VQKFKRYFNKFSGILTLMLGIATSQVYEAFSCEWWFAVMIFAYGVSVGVLQQQERDERNKNAK
jgi:hypothetical protein